MAVFDQLRDGTAYHRSQFYQDITMPFYGFNRPGAKISQGIRDNWWRQGMMGGIKAQYDCVKALSETDFFDDLKSIDVPVLVMHGLDDQICPFESSGAHAVKLVKNGPSKPIPASRMGCQPPTQTKSTPTCSRSSKRLPPSPLNPIPGLRADEGRGLLISRETRSYLNDALT